MYFGAAWNSYRGTLRQRPDGGALADLHSVALHEFGHVLGLNGAAALKGCAT